MKLAIHQPNLLPWGGFWRKMEDADEFVILDDAQFTKGSYINRVRMGDGSWVTIPVHYEYGQRINEVQIHNPRQNCNKLFNTIYHNYPKVADHFHWLTEVPGEMKLLGLNMQLIEVVRNIMTIDTPLRFSSDMPTLFKGSDRILQICIELGYEEYLTGSGGRNYLDIDEFDRFNVDVEFVSYGKQFNDITILKHLNENNAFWH